MPAGPRLPLPEQVLRDALIPRRPGPPISFADLVEVPISTAQHTGTDEEPAIAAHERPD